MCRAAWERAQSPIHSLSALEHDILLNPGPVNVSERVRQALMRPDICHRESEFSDLLTAFSRNC